MGSGGQVGGFPILKDILELEDLREYRFPSGVSVITAISESGPNASEKHSSHLAVTLLSHFV